MLVLAKTRGICLALFALATAPVAQAQWTGKAELGVVLASGNTESKAANTKFDMTHEGTRWRNSFFFGALYSENASFATAERYEARYQADYKITDKLAWFSALRGEQDRYSGFAYQVTVSTGASYKFIDSVRTKHSASLGVGYRRMQEEILIKTDAGEVIGRIEGEEFSEPVATFTSNYEHAITENTKITNKLLAEAGADNTAIQNDLALHVNMTKTLAIAIGIGVRYNTDPPPLAEDTDTLTTVNLVYNIL